MRQKKNGVGGGATIATFSADRRAFSEGRGSTFRAVEILQINNLIVSVVSPGRYRVETIT